jgi:hypothetical protein
LTEGLGLNRGDACLEARTAVLPELCDMAWLQRAACTSGAGEPERCTWQAGQAGERKGMARDQKVQAVARFASGFRDLRPNVRDKLPA